MAIEVIKRGKYRKVICSICAAELKYEKEDLKSYYTGCYEIECPECNQRIPVEPWNGRVV